MTRIKNIRKILNSNHLKVIAICAMTIDHLTWALFPGFQTDWRIIILHIIGRLTAPIMWFFIAEGCYYTHDRIKYLLRLFIFALISHFAYDFAFGIPFFDPSLGFFNRTSVMWSLFIAAALIFTMKYRNMPTVLKFVIIFTACIIAFPSDWSSIAVMAPFFIYQHRGRFRLQAFDIVLWTAVYATVYFFAIDRLYAILQMFTFLSVPLLFLYNGERGKLKGMKWFFYIYYPAHLIIIGIIRLLLHGNIRLIA